MRGGSRHRPSTKAPTPSPLSRRDSDANSLCSSRSVSTSAFLSDRSSQSSALRAINIYLSSISAPFSLKPPLPSAKDITSCFKLFLSRLHFNTSSSSSSLEDDLLILLKTLNCPIKFNRSALKAPGTPHSWPALLSVLFWLMQLVRYTEHCFSTPAPAQLQNDLLDYTIRSYSLFIKGNDEAAEEADREYFGNVERELEKKVEAVKELEKEAAELEEIVRTMKAGPSRKEEMERERDLLIEDVKKFMAVVERNTEVLGEKETTLKEMETELEVKERERERIREENEELRRQIEGQAVNARDVERMRREMAVLEREIAEAESGRNAMEEKAWEVEEEVGRKLKEVEGLVEQGILAIRKLKLGDDLQFVLNPKGSTPAEVMGIDYKNILKPSLTALSEDTNNASISKLEELKVLQQQSRENTAMLEQKKTLLAALQAKVEEGDTRVKLIKKEIEDHASKCATEAKLVLEEHTKKEHELSIVEKEAEEFLKSSEKMLEDAIKETDEENQLCACELLAVIDSVSEYKEFMESLSSTMKAELMEHVKFVGDANASAVLSKMESIDLHRNLKRTRSDQLD